MIDKQESGWGDPNINLPTDAETSTTADPPPTKTETPEDYSLRVQKRINNLTARAKNAEEERQALAQRLAKQEAEMADLRKATQTIQSTSADAVEKQLQDKIRLAQEAFSQAFDVGDKAKMADANNQLVDAKLDLRQVQTSKAAREEAVETPVVQPAPQRQQPAQPDPLAAKWVQDNKAWWGVDEARTVVALQLDARLKQEGYDPRDPEFYTEIDRGLRTEFPHKYRSSGDEGESEGSSERPSPTAPPPRRQTQSGASRTPGTKKTALTEGEARYAKIMGIKPADYEAQKARIQEQDVNGYTPIFS